MTKVLIAVAALCLALPGSGFAGSATSRWDLTIGGYVKVDAGFTSQASGPAAAGLEQYWPDRDNAGRDQNVANKSGSFDMATGQTALNFLVKGPDTWGAKSTAFIQGNFLGVTTNSGTAGARYGTFTMTHAYMDLTWPATKLTVGQTWQSWGFLPSYTFLGVYDLLMAGRGNTVPQITVTRNFGTGFRGSIGIQEPYNSRDQIGGSANLATAQSPLGMSSVVGFNTSSVRVTTDIPDFTAEIDFTSEAAGKIGPQALQLALGGFWGQDNIIYTDTTRTAAYNVAHATRWATALKAFVPLIPEKNLNKAGALSLSGSVWTGQNLANWFLGARNIIAPIPYDQSMVNGRAHYTTPVTSGGWGQISYHITDKVYVNGLYGYTRNSVSAGYQGLYPNQIKQWQQIIGNVIYDANAAVRVGVEYNYTTATFNAPGLNNGGLAAPPSEQLTGYTPAAGTSLGSTGKVHQGRIAVWYFF